MQNPADRLNAAMEERRLELNLEWRDIAKHGGLAYETLRALRRTGRASALSKRRIENGLLWAPGSIDSVLAGGDPAVAAGARVDGYAVRAEDLEMLIAETEDELRTLSPKYESNRASLTEHLEKRLADLRRQLDALTQQ